MKKFAEMENAIIAKFGFEHPNTIKFFKMTSKHYASMKMVKFYFDKFMDEDLDNDDE
jgi:hypothetical protein